MAMAARSYIMGMLIVAIVAGAAYLSGLPLPSWWSLATKAPRLDQPPGDCTDLILDRATGRTRAAACIPASSIILEAARARRDQTSS